MTFSRPRSGAAPHPGPRDGGCWPSSGGVTCISPEGFRVYRVDRVDRLIGFFGFKRVYRAYRV